MLSLNSSMSHRGTLSVRNVFLSTSIRSRQSIARLAHSHLMTLLELFLADYSATQMAKALREAEDR